MVKRERYSLSLGIDVIPKVSDFKTFIAQEFSLRQMRRVGFSEKIYSETPSWTGEESFIQ